MLPLLLIVALQEPAQGVSASCDDCALQFDLAADKAVYEVGEPIALSVQLTNAGSEAALAQHTSDVTGPP
jgi:hypothetical protein